MFHNLYAISFSFGLQDGERVRLGFVAKTPGTLSTGLNGIYLAVSVCNSDLEIAPYMIYHMLHGSLDMMLMQLLIFFQCSYDMVLTVWRLGFRTTVMIY